MRKDRGDRRAIRYADDEGVATCTFPVLGARRDQEKSSSRNGSCLRWIENRAISKQEGSRDDQNARSSAVERAEYQVPLGMKKA